MKMLSFLAIVFIVSGCAMTMPEFQQQPPKSAGFSTKETVIGDKQHHIESYKSGRVINKRTSEHATFSGRIIMTAEGKLTKDELDCLYNKKGITLCKRCDPAESNNKCCENILPKCKQCIYEESNLQNRVINKIQ